MHQLVTLICLALLGFQRIQAFTGASYWNARYSAEGINYDTTNMFWGLWSRSGYRGNYHLSTGSYGGRLCSGCSCNENQRIVTGCSGAVTLKGYVFDNLTAESFTAGITSLTIINCPSFKIWGPKAFTGLSSLKTIIITQTGLTQFPEISATDNSALERMMLGNNAIQFFSHNTSKINWPGTLKQLSLIENQINYIPDGFFSGSSLQYVGLSRNKITQFPAAAFDGVTSLVFLGVDENEVTGISTEHINYIAGSQIQHLNVSNNKITHIAPGALSNLVHLKIIEAHNNELTECRSGVFDNIPKLIHLDLVKNKIKILKANSFTNLPELITLRVHSQLDKMTNIYYNAFKDINAKLKNLWVSDNALTSFPHQVLSEQSYTSLQELYADHNQIKNITEYTTDAFSIGLQVIYASRQKTFSVWAKYPNIRKLILGYNSIPKLGASDLCPLTSILTLELNNNLLVDETFADDVFDCIPTLQYLHLENNLFKYVPKAVRSGNLTALTELFLSGNKLTFIETGTFVNVTALTSLYLQSNSIIVVENEAFPNSVRNLNLQSNEFRFTHENPFTNMSNLAYLVLSYNKIDYIPDTAFHGCTALNSLYLFSNNIGWLKKVYFVDNPLASIFQAANNDIAYIEDGTFQHITSISFLYLYSNKLTKLPKGGDFSNLTVSYLSLQDNRFTEIPARVFENLHVRGKLDLSNSEISSIHTGAFKGVTIGYDLVLSGNSLRTIEPSAFVSVTADSIYLNNMKITYIPEGAFQSVSAHDIFLHQNAIQYIEQNAFNAVTLSDDLTLYSNVISSLRGSIFNSTSVGGRLDLTNNLLQVIPGLAFSGLTNVNQIDMDKNKLSEYPSNAFASKGLKRVDLSNNKISTLSLAAFLNQGTFDYLDLSNNNISSISKGLMDPLVNLKTFKLSDNQIGYIEPDAFSTLTKLEKMDLANNKLFFFPKLPNMTRLTSLDLSNNILKSFEQEALDDFEGSKVFVSLILTGNNEIGCDCYVYSTLKKVKKTITGGTCGSSPTAVNGSRFDSSKATDPKYFLRISTDKYLCSPVDVQATSLTATDITVSWVRPKNAIISNANVTDAEASAWSYEVTCVNSVSSVSHTSTINGTNHTFTAADGIQSNTEYVCTVSLVLSASDISSPSQQSVVTTQMQTVNATTNSTIDVNDYLLPITYYDFSISHVDFSGYVTTVISKPSYVSSPYGAWLMKANSVTPSSDTFSTWFVYKIGTNQRFYDNLTLSLISSSPPTHRYVTNLFYPLDDLGYKKEEKDCYFNERNMGFTSAVRTGVVYKGTETIAVGGGDEMWVYINGVLMLELTTRDAGVQIPCKTIDISAASATGGAIITPRSGFVINSQCVTTADVTSEKVNLDLEVGERYHFAIFHAERLICASRLFIEVKNFQFILDSSSSEEPPQDYIVSKKEDFHNDGIIQELVLADIFSTGPFDVTIQKGNEARHFTLVEDTTTNRNKAVAPAPVTYIYTTVRGVSFVECSSPSTITPEGNTPGTELFPITTEKALLTLDLALDYEAQTSYTLVIEVVDKGKTPKTTGTITIKIQINDVNDNCPELTQTSFSMFADPSLQSSALAKLNATDIDSGHNSALFFFLSSVTEDPPVVYNSSSDLYKEVYAMNTTLKFSVVVTDNGTPMRGAQSYAELIIDNSCLVDAEFGPISYSVTVQNISGSVFFRVPGYYFQEYACLDALGMESASILDNQISTSSSDSLSGPERGRLNILGLSAEFGSFTGGWLAATDDSSQWIQVMFNETIRINKIQVQGQEDADNWVTTFTLTYSNDDVTWNTFVNDTGVSVFSGATDRSTVVDISLSPILKTKYIRINPQTWNNHIAVRMEIIGCTQSQYVFYRTTCQRCLTTYYCTGDGSKLPCGRCDPPQSGSTCGRSPTEHSFGIASQCSPCLDGWKCENGYAEKCPLYHYITCNETYCPSACTQCEAGYACREGRRKECGIGTFSTGSQEDCQMCDGGSYQDLKAQTSCKKCPAGYYSSKKKDRCNPCGSGTYSDDQDSTCKSCGAECLCSGSNGTRCFREDLCFNKLIGGVYSFGCLPCPDGYNGDGSSCTDIDECTDNNPCWNQSCMNTSPGYQCHACPLGYIGTYEDALSMTVYRRVFEEKNEARAALNYQTCNDVNECNINNGNCDGNSYCVNTVGSYYCGKCKKGYLPNPLGGCKLADFYLSGECTCNSKAECVYTGPGKYKCQCNTGWAGDGADCETDTDLDGRPDTGLGCTQKGCARDNCQTVPNSGLEDVDTDSTGDMCDNDADNDNRYGSKDNCPLVSNTDQADGDSDGVGNVCDNCPSNSNPDQADLDNDGVGDVCDTDKDGDGVTDGGDNCPLVANAGQTDGDGDGVGDECDNCPVTANAGQTDANDDGIGDACSNQDKDGDGIEASRDNCDEIANGEQQDTDGDTIGDYCDPDIDNDGTLNDDDNCVYVSNPNQTDINGNHRGDACESDLDQDGTLDGDDNCPKNKDINDTSFSNYVSLDFDPSLSSEASPFWQIKDGGKDVKQFTKTLKPVALIGNQYFDHVKFMGTTYADTTDCFGYMGFIFGYRGTRKYYLVSWRHMYLNMENKGGTKGVQLWLVNSATTSPGTTYSQALYHSSDTTDITKLLWQDPNLTGWECKTPYRWTIEHSPSIGLIRVLVEQGETTIADSGYIYDVTITGGRLGVFAHNQTANIWSNLKYECTDRLNYALELGGISDYGVIGNLSDLGIEKSFTVEVWVLLASGYLSIKLPIVCTNESELCLYIEGGVFYIQVGSTIMNGSTTITADVWTHITARYNAQQGILTMFMNGAGTLVTREAELQDLPEITWNGDLTLYLGRSNSNYFKGKIDELRIYNIQIPNKEVDNYWQKVGMSRDYNKYTVSAHYTMDNNTDSSILMDQGPKNLDVKLYGSPKFVEGRYEVLQIASANGKSPSAPSVEPWFEGQGSID